MLAIFALAALDALFSTPTLAGAHVGAYVADAQTGRVLYERHAARDFIPASTMKLVVGSASLDDLGTAFSFVTTVGTDGRNLYVQGGGDVLLRERDLQDGAAAIRALGFTSFSGALIGDATRFDGSRYPPGWQVDDLPYDYAAPPSALSFDENALHLTIAPSSPGEPPAIAISPADVAVRVVNDATTGAARSEDTTDLRYDWTTPQTLTVVGSVPAGGSPSTLDASMLDPARVTLALFAHAFGNAGIHTDGEQIFAAMPPSARVLWQRRSPQLAQILADMWLPSDNLIAETLLEELGAQAPGAGTTRARGIERERQWLASIGIDSRTMTIADGCGMSIYDRITPQDLGIILAHDWHGPFREIVLHALPVAGKSGTLEHAYLGTPLVGTVVAKTGSSMHNRTLAGYLETPHGTLIFALMVNNWMDHAPGADERLRAFQERFLERIRDDASGVP